MKTQQRVRRIVSNYLDMVRSCKTFTIADLRSYYHQFDGYTYPPTYRDRINTDCAVLMNSNPELYVWCKYINRRVKKLYYDWVCGKSSTELGKVYGSLQLPEGKDYFKTPCNLHILLTYSTSPYKERIKKEIYIHG